MKAIMVMFDSLNRHMLPTYGCDWVHAPNFQRLAERSVTFDRSFVGSMPCMPARRELHTGRYNFLHRSWGPIEPFDDSMPEILKYNQIHSHLISDHYHYWEEGGCNYHTRYESWEISRGQEGDPWMGAYAPPSIEHPNPTRDGGRRNGMVYQDWINRQFMQDENNLPQIKTTRMGLEFLDRNHGQDNWFLHVETFDPHEPYFVPDRFKQLYDYDFSKITESDWPSYDRADERPDLSEHYRYLNAALISMCDECLGKIMDKMDELDLWKDTMLIVNTDHGFLLGEHDWWGKCRMPFYNEIALTPLFIWDPRSGKRNERRRSLVQTIDLPATILEYFNVERPADMQGQPLKATVESDAPVREAGLFGLHGGHVNVTDGRYVYMRAPVNEDNRPLYNYTLMPTHMRHTFSAQEMHNLEGLAEPFGFTKGCQTMKIDAGGPGWATAHGFGHLLFDMDEDPRQQRPLQAPDVEKAMLVHLEREMKANDAPPEQFERLGLG